MSTPTFYDLLQGKGIRPIDLAGKLGVDKATVSRWAYKEVPASRILEVEKITGIPRQQLRPDLYEDATHSPEAA